MTTINATPTHVAPPTPLRAGLAISATIGASQAAFLHPDIDWGNADPGVPAIALGAVIGLVSVVCAILAWNSGSRRLIRINAAALIVNGLLIVPGLFVDTTAFIKLATAVLLVATVTAVVLLLRRQQEPSPVVD